MKNLGVISASTTNFWFNHCIFQIIKPENNFQKEEGMTEASSKLGEEKTYLKNFKNNPLIVDGSKRHIHSLFFSSE